MKLTIQITDSGINNAEGVFYCLEAIRQCLEAGIASEKTETPTGSWEYVTEEEMS